MDQILHNRYFHTARAAVVLKAAKSPTFFVTPDRRAPDAMDYVRGGALICIELALASVWGGIDRLSAPSEGSATEYDRACTAGFYATGIPLPGGMALVVDTGPQDTSVWTSESGISYIVVVEYAEPDVDEPALLASLDDSIFDRPLSVTEVTFASADLVMFDAAERGDERDKKVSPLTIKPGRYRVLSQTFDPNRETSFTVHKLELLS